jgi:hypothetical protein
MSIDTPDAEFLVKAYPNPTRDFININSSELKSAVLYDLQGRIILETNENKLNLSSMNSGVFILRVITADEKTATFKIIKE